MRRHDLRRAIAASSLVGLAGLHSLASCALTAETGESAGEAPETKAVIAVEVLEREALASGAEWNAAAMDYARRQLRRGTAQRSDGLSLQELGGGATPEGVRFLRMQQRYRGLAILGADLVVVGKGGALSSLHGHALADAESLRELDGLIDAKIDGRGQDEQRAQAQAFARYLAKVTDRTAQIEVVRRAAELVIAPGGEAGARSEGPRLAYRVELVTEQQAGVEPGRWVTLIDAITGEILEEHNALHLLSQASGPGGNPNVVRSWVAQLDVEPTATPNVFQMDTAKLRTTNMNHATSGPGTIVTGPLSPIGDAAINDAHGFAEIALNHMLAWYSQNSINGAGMKITSRVHYGTNYGGGFWDGSTLTWGDGAAGAFYAPQGSLDSVAHELAHGFTIFNSNLTYANQSGGMSESFSDIVGEAAEAFYKNAAPDFVVGADIVVGGGFFRDLCTPTANGSQIDHISSYTAGMSVHRSSGIMNKAFCRTAKRMASGSPTGAATLASVKRASQAWYRANKVYWTSSSTFQQACAGVFLAGSDLGFTDYEKWALRQSWIDVGITCGTATSPVTFAVDSLSTFENAGVMIFTVTKTNYDGAFHSVAYAGAAGTATVGVDYQDFSGTLSFAPSDTTRYVAVAINDDAMVEGNEKFTVNLSGLTGGGTIVSPQGIGTILNDD